MLDVTGRSRLGGTGGNRASRAAGTFRVGEWKNKNFFFFPPPLALARLVGKTRERGLKNGCTLIQAGKETKGKMDKKPVCLSLAMAFAHRMSGCAGRGRRRCSKRRDARASGPLAGPGCGPVGGGSTSPSSSISSSSLSSASASPALLRAAALPAGRGS